MEGQNKKKHKTITISPAARILLRRIATKAKRSDSNQIEVLIEEEAKRQNIQ